jgi:hypothetical protein
MNIYLGANLITGMALGIEYIEGDENFLPSISIDLLIVRLLISWGSDEEAAKKPEGLD